MGITLNIGKKSRPASFIAFLGICLITCLLSMFWSYESIRNVQVLEQKALALQAKAISSKEVREKRTSFLKSHRISGNPLPFHFSQNFYTGQKEALGSCFTASFFAPSADQKKSKEDLLKQQASSILEFSETSRDQSKTLLEAINTQREITTVDQKDLIEILQYFEGNEIEAVKPQTIIKDMLLIKNPNNQSFNIKMQVLQRNFIK